MEEELLSLQRQLRAKVPDKQQVSNLQVRLVLFLQPSPNVQGLSTIFRRFLRVSRTVAWLAGCQPPADIGLPLCSCVYQALLYFAGGGRYEGLNNVVENLMLISKQWSVPPSFHRCVS